jgi:hypothetical protein
MLFFILFNGDSVNVVWFKWLTMQSKKCITQNKQYLLLVLLKTPWIINPWNFMCSYIRQCIICVVLLDYNNEPFISLNALCSVSEESKCIIVEKGQCSLVVYSYALDSFLSYHFLTSPSMNIAFKVNTDI